MRTLIALARAIDALNERVGRVAPWLVLAVTVLAASNAVVRYAFNYSSNAWLEAQWYLFAAIFLLAAGFTLKHNGHVRIDVIYGHLSARARAWIDLAGSVLFLLPLCGYMVYASWPGFVESFANGEVSPDAGGLIRWPVRLIIPAGFALLAAQGVAEAIKSAAYLRGLGDFMSHEKPREEV